MEEVFASPLTTPTTCYSSGRNGLVKGNGALQFATEHHILSVRTGGGADNNSSVKTACRSLPRDASQWTCVGYAHWEEEEEQDCNNNNNDTESDQISTVFQMEAIALLDPELVAAAANSSSNNNSNLHKPDHKDDTASVATPSSSTIQSKRTSVSTIGTATTAPLTLAGSYHRKSQSELSKGSHNTTSDTNLNHLETDPKALLTEPKSKARLVLKQDRYSIHRSSAVAEANDKSGENPEKAVYRRQFRQSSVALLDFRPLCPCIAKWRRGQETNDFVGIWVGSADDAVLRLYKASSADPRSLVPIPLPEEHFSVDSPVMALDFRSVGWSSEASTTHTLAVACQDGTIQLITWTTPASSSKSLFGEAVASQKVIVDGPLVCLKLDYHRLASLRAIVGSLCGFVCQLTYHPQTMAWDGPHMVVQDLLYHSNLNMEESVLAVDLWENYVAIGTQLGRCLLYATQNSENYCLVWQVFLPYPVHDICILAPPTTNQSLLLPSLGVTTRRSFHVFRRIPERTAGVPWKQTPKRETYHSELAKQRLVDILAGIRTENEASDSATRQCVLEIMQDLLDTVEATATKHAPEPNPLNRSAIKGVAPAHDSVVEEEKLDTTTSSSPPIDAPHWEYSSSDEEEEGTEEAVPRSPTTGEAEC